MVKRLMSMTLLFSFLLCINITVYAQETDFPLNPYDSGFSESVMIEDQSYTFQYGKDDNGNVMVQVIDADNNVDIVTYNEATKDLYLNGNLVEKVSVPYSHQTREVIKGDNWVLSSDSPIIHNYLVENFTLATLAAAISAVTGGVASVISGAIAGAFYSSVWMSALEWHYYNYTDYGAYKTAFYKYCEVYSGYDATGSVLYTYTSPVTVR